MVVLWIRDEDAAGFTYAMTARISKCYICDQFFQTRKELREHKDKNHRITNEKIIVRKKDNEEEKKKKNVGYGSLRIRDKRITIIFSELEKKVREFIYLFIYGCCPGGLFPPRFSTNSSRPWPWHLPCCPGGSLPP